MFMCICEDWNPAQNRCGEDIHKHVKTTIKQALSEYSQSQYSGTGRIRAGKKHAQDCLLYGNSMCTKKTSLCKISKASLGWEGSSVLRMFACTCKALHSVLSHTVNSGKRHCHELSRPLITGNQYSNF